MLAIFKKEFRSFFGGLLGYIYLAANLFFASWYFQLYELTQGYPYISYVINGMLMIFLFSLPLLTMRSFSEEMRHKTDQLLFTSPVPVWKIIVGKYLAVLSVFAIPVLVISLYPLVLRMFGEVPMAENYLSVFGFFLFGAACLAIGIFVSSLTDNQILAAILTFFVLLLGLMVNNLKALISQTENPVTMILSAFDLASEFDYFQYGIFSVSGLVYYLSIIGLCLYFTYFVITSRRISISTRGIGRNFLRFFTGFVVIVFAIAINIFSRTMPESVRFKDITYNSIYSISNETKQFLDNVESDVTLYYWVDNSGIDETLEHTLVNISEYSDKVKLVYVSPTDNPYFYTAYTDVVPTQNSVIAVANDTAKIVDYYDCYSKNYNLEYDFETGNYVITNYSVVGYDGEGRILSAIKYVDIQDSPVIYCVTGHDELEIEEGLKSRLEKANLAVENLLLFDVDEVPEDADALFILGPLSEFSDDDVRKVSNYLENGGNAIIIVAYTDSDELNNYYSLLEPYNISVHPGLVIEQGTSFYNSQPYYLLPNIIECDMTEGVYSYLRNKYVYMPYAKGFGITEGYGDVSTLSFLETTENAYCLIDVLDESEEEAAPETECYSLGVYAEKTYPEWSSKIVAFSSDYFLYQDIDSAVSGDNYDVFMNCVGKILGQENEHLAPVKNYSYSTIMINETFTNIFSMILIVIIPVAILISGFLVWTHRRKY